MLPEGGAGAVAGFRGRFLSDAWWNFIAGIVPSAATFVGTIVIARILGRDGFGRFSLVQASVVAFGLYASVALGATGAKAIAEVRSHDSARAAAIRRETVRLSLAISSVCALGVVVFADAISEGAFGDHRLAQPLRIASAGLIILGVLATVTGSLSGYGRFRQVALVGCVRGGTTVPCLALGAWAAGVGGAVAGLVAAGAFGVATAVFLLRRYEPSVPGERRGMRRSNIRALLFGFSLPVFIGPGLFLLVNAVVSFLLARGSGGAAEVALWNAAMQIRLILLFVPTTLAMPILVSVAAARGMNNLQSVRRTVRLGSAIVAGSAIIPAILLGLKSDVVLGVFGASFVGTGPLVEKVVAATVISTVPFVIESSMRGAGYAWRALSITVVWSLIMLGGFVAVPERDASSTATLLLASYLVVLPLSVWLWLRAQQDMREVPLSQTRAR